MLQLVLFDLDGTLLDTAPDLGLALNMQRERHGLPPLPQDTIRPYASHGSKGLLSVGFSLTQEHVNFGDMREEYLAIYDEVMTQSPTLFEGMKEGASMNVFMSEMQNVIFKRVKLQACAP